MLNTIMSQWIALSILFLLASVFSERTVRFGYVLIPIIAGLFIFIGWLPIGYFGVIFPVMMGLGVITFLKEQFRIKLSGYGATGSLLWKIMAFMIVLQFSIVFVNGLALFGTTQYIPSDTTFTSQYTIDQTATYGAYTDKASFTDQLYVGFTMIWGMFGLMFQMLLGIFQLYANMILVFHLHPLVSAFVSMGVYLMFFIELFILIYRPAKQPGI